jgi:hypothetical protein
VSLTAGLFLACCSLADSQTLEQTVAFILYNGEVELSNMTTNSDGSVEVPLQQTTLLLTTPPRTIKVNDRQNCEIEVVAKSLLGKPEDHVIYYFNRIIEFRDQPTQAGIYVWAISEGPAMTGGTDILGQPTTNSTNPILAVYSQNLDRVHGAIKYMYSKFCSFAKRKSAF